MAYFEYFPLTEYQYAGDAYFTQAVNILKRVKVRDTILTQGAFYYLYQVQDGERPEIIAGKYYGNSGLHWIIMLTNTILDPFFGWPLSVNNLNRYAQQKYGSGLYDTYGWQLYSKNPLRNGLWMPSPTVIAGLPISFQEKLYDAGSETINPVTNYDWETMQNDAKRQIRLFRPELIPEFVKEFSSLVAS